MPRKLRRQHARQEACQRTMCCPEVWSRGLRGHPGNYINHGRFWLQETIRRAKTGKRVTGRYNALGNSLVLDYPVLSSRQKPELMLAPDCPALSGRENPQLTWLAKAEKQGESKMVRCREMSLTRISKVEKWVNIKMIQCFDMVLCQSCERSGSLKICISPCVYISAVFDSLLHSTIS